MRLSYLILHFDSALRGSAVPLNTVTRRPWHFVRFVFSAVTKLPMPSANLRCDTPLEIDFFFLFKTHAQTSANLDVPTQGDVEGLRVKWDWNSKQDCVCATRLWKQIKNRTDRCSLECVKPWAWKWRGVKGGGPTAHHTSQQKKENTQRCSQTTTVQQHSEGSYIKSHPGIVTFREN